MKALGCREAKRNLSLFGQTRVQPGNGGRQAARGFAGTLPGRKKFWESKFDGHFGLRRAVQTVDMLRSPVRRASAFWRVCASISGITREDAIMPTLYSFQYRHRA